MPSARRSRTRREAEKEGYRSGFELATAKQLEECGVEFEYEPKREILTYEVHEVRRYLPDFVINEKMIIECKGRLTAADRKKMLLLKAQHPKKDIRLLFQYDNKLNPRSKTRYSAWADKHKFPWAVGTIPEEWIKK